MSKRKQTQWPFGQIIIFLCHSRTCSCLSYFKIYLFISLFFYFLISFSFNQTGPLHIHYGFCFCGFVGFLPLYLILLPLLVLFSQCLLFVLSNYNLFLFHLVILYFIFILLIYVCILMRKRNE